MFGILFLIVLRYNQVTEYCVLSYRGLDEILTCRYGHQRRTELLFPRSKCICLQKNIAHTYSSDFYNSL